MGVWKKTTQAPQSSWVKLQQCKDQKSLKFAYLYKQNKINN